jgi:glycosyltransferase involved in cell wall biosynthesis
MKISVVTVALNAADTIADTLRSVAEQTHPAIEHIVVDGGSTDGTVDVVKRFGERVARLVSEPDQGLYHAMNKGIALATGEVVGTLNADDMYMHEGVLARVASVFEDASVEACYGDLIYVDRADTDRIVRYWT